MRNSNPSAADDHRSRPPHLRWQFLGLVAIGGALGTAAREAVALTVPRSEPFPVAVFLINVTGAFLLGVVLEALGRSGLDLGAARGIRLLVGTGFLGGFTTYSALATDTSVLTASGFTGTALVYAVGTLVVGGAATWAGILAGGRLAGRESAS